jgi:DNA primase
LINYFHQNETFELENYLQQLSPEISNEVTSILMNDEREILHNWETKHIYVKDKNKTISQYVTETILTLRWYLVNKIIDELKNGIEKPTEENPEVENSETLSMAVDYLGLTNVFSKKLGRVISRHN